MQVGVCEWEREHEGVEWLNDPSNAEQRNSDVTILPAHWYNSGVTSHCCRHSNSDIPTSVTHTYTHKRARTHRQTDVQPHTHSTRDVTAALCVARDARDVPQTRQWRTVTLVVLRMLKVPAGSPWWASCRGDYIIIAVCIDCSLQWVAGNNWPLNHSPPHGLVPLCTDPLHSWGYSSTFCLCEWGHAR